MTEWQLEVMATILVGCLLVVSAIIAIFILHRFRKLQSYKFKVFWTELLHYIILCGLDDAPTIHEYTICFILISLYVQASHPHHQEARLAKCDPEEEGRY